MDTILILHFAIKRRPNAPIKLNGIVNITIRENFGDSNCIAITTKPGLTVEANNEILEKVEELVAGEEDLDHYLLTYGDSGLSFGGGNSATLSAYLKDDRKISTAEMIKKWRKETQKMTDCTITLENGSSSGSSSMQSDNIEIDISSVDYEAAKAVAKDMVAQLKQRKDVTKVHSDVENAAPVVKVNIDPVKAQAEGITPASIGGVIYSTLSGTEVMKLNSTGENTQVKVEFAPDEYDTIDKLEGLLLNTPAGTQVPLSDIADIYYADSPMTITRVDKQYKVAITCEAVEGYEDTAETDVKKFATALAAS